MPFSSGTFSRVHDWTSDRDAGIKISASRTDAEFDGIATALTSTMLKDGSQTLTAMIPFTLGLSVPTDKKIQLRDSDIFLRSSADGQADLVANSVIQVTAPTVNIEASTAITLESDAITLGENGDTDIVLTFNANSADGVITWKEDEDYFLLSDDILMNSTEKIQFGDTASFIQQSSDGVLRIDGEATIDLNASTAVTVSNDLKLDSDGAILGFGADNEVTLTHVHDTGLSLNDKLTITTADNDDHLELISTDADASSGPALRFYRNSSSPADDDTMTTIRFEGNNDAGQVVVYNRMRADISDASDGTEDGVFHIFNMMAGTERTMFSIKPDEVVFNEENRDVDFRVESDGNTHALFVDAGTDTVCINTTDTNFDAGADDLIVGSGSGDCGITIYTGANVGDNGSIFFADSTVGSNAEKKGQISYEQNTEKMRFFTNATEQVGIDLNGNVNINNGNLVIGTGGKGIDFTQATNDSEMTSELLDDYEEGLATMSFIVGSGSITIATGYSKLAYTKIGRMVQINGQLASSAVSGIGTGQYLQINGLPFAAADLGDVAGRSGFHVAHDSANMVDGREIFGLVNEGGAVINIYEQNSAGASNKAEIMDSNTSLYFSFTYNTT